MLVWPEADVKLYSYLLIFTTRLQNNKVNHLGTEQVLTYGKLCGAACEGDVESKVLDCLCASWLDNEWIIIFIQVR